MDITLSSGLTVLPFEVGVTEDELLEEEVTTEQVKLLQREGITEDEGRLVPGGEEEGILLPGAEELLPGAKEGRLLPGTEEERLLPGVEEERLLPGVEEGRLLPGPRRIDCYQGPRRRVDC